MGVQSSKIEKDLGEDFPPGEHYFGCENVIFFHFLKLFSHFHFSFVPLLVNLNIYRKKIIFENKSGSFFTIFIESLEEITKN